MIAEDIGMAPEILEEIRASAMGKGLRDPYRAYLVQKNGAAGRGIAWEFTFASWWAIWSDYYHLRGASKNGLCMGRHGDVGPYSPDNVYLTTRLGNLADARVSEKACLRRAQTKERRERAFARSRSRNIAGNVAAKSEAVYLSKHGNTSTCNHSEDPLF